MAWTEDITRRGRQYKIFTDGLGHEQLHDYLHDVHYLDDALTWQDVDENLVNESGTFAHQCVKVRHAIHLATTSRKRWMPRRDHPTEYIDFGRLQYWTGSAWSNLNLGTPVRSGNTLTWDIANFTLKLAVIWRSVKIEAVLKNSNAAKRLRWSVTLSGMTWSNWSLVSNSDSMTVGTVRKPKAWDANGSSRDPNVTITPSYSGGYIEFTGDLSTAVYPVVIDPTLDVQPDAAAGIDNFTYDGAGNSNYGTDAGIEVYCWTGTINEIGLIKFDLSSIPGDATIDDGALTLYAKQVGNTAATTHLHRILAANNSWAEATSTWNYQDGAGGGHRWAGDAGEDGGSDAGCSVSGTDYSAVLLGSCAYGASDPADTEYVFDLDVDEITTMVDANYGNIIWQSASTPNSYITYKSSDHADAAKRPHLVINYTLAGGGPININLAAAAVAASGQDFTVTPGAVAPNLDAAVLNVAGQVAAIVAGAIAINLDVATTTATGQTTAIIAGAVSVSLISAALSASGQTTTITPGAVAVTLANASLAAQGQTIIVSAIAGTSIDLDSANIAASGQASGITAGAVSIALASGALSAQGQTTTIVPGAVGITMACATLAAHGQIITITPGAVSLAMSVAGLSANGQTIAVIPGAISISLDAAVLLSAGQIIVIIAAIIYYTPGVIYGPSINGSIKGPSYSGTIIGSDYTGVLT